MRPIAMLAKSVQAEAAQPLDGDHQIALQRRLESRITEHASRLMHLADSASHHVMHFDGSAAGEKQVGRRVGDHGREVVTEVVFGEGVLRGGDLFGKGCLAYRPIGEGLEWGWAGALG